MWRAAVQCALFGCHGFAFPAVNNPPEPNLFFLVRNVPKFHENASITFSVFLFPDKPADRSRT